MNMQSYPALLEPSADGYGVRFPDLPGCTSFGRDLDEAVSLGAEALSLHLSAMIEDGDRLPEPSSLAEVHALEEAQGDTLAVISAQIEEGSDRVNVYLPRQLLARADGFAAATGANRSGVIGVALRQFLDAPTEGSGARGRKPRRHEQSIAGALQARDAKKA